ncbi:MAG: ATPase domain-containing protein [Candidatus Thermoplasmatota archaeon]
MTRGDRVRTFIQGFDEKLSGGIPEGSIVLLCGEPGTMKSTLAFNVLYHNAMRANLGGVYMTLEQNREGLAHHLRQMGLDPKDVEERVSIVDLGMIRKNLTPTQDGWFEIFKMYAGNMKRTLGFDLFVVDSLPVLEVMARFPNPREDLFRLFEWIRDLGATSFLISEMSTPQDPYGKHGEEFLADGIIAVKMQSVDDANIQRRIRCVKLRGTAHSPNFYTLIYQNGLFQVTRVLGD